MCSLSCWPCILTYCCVTKLCHLLFIEYLMFFPCYNALLFICVIWNVSICVTSHFAFYKILCCDLSGSVWFWSWELFHEINCFFWVLQIVWWWWMVGKQPGTRRQESSVTVVCVLKHSIRSTHYKGLLFILNPSTKIFYTHTWILMH